MAFEFWGFELPKEKDASGYDFTSYCNKDFTKLLNFGNYSTLSFRDTDLAYFRKVVEWSFSWKRFRDEYCRTKDKIIMGSFKRFEESDRAKFIVDRISKAYRRYQGPF